MCFVCSSNEKQCYKLREDAVQMQTKIVDLTHETKLHQLKMLSKATMTDEESPCQCDSSPMTDTATQVTVSPLIPVTDSATQVNVSPDVRDVQVSPIKWERLSNVRGSQEKATQTFTAALGSPFRSHRRSQSEGDSLYYRKRAKDAFSRVKTISKQLQDASLYQQKTDHSPQDSSDARGGKQNNNEIETVKCGGHTSKPESIASNQRESSLPHTDVHASHKSTSQQQVRTLQNKVKVLRRQV